MLFGLEDEGRNPVRIIIELNTPIPELHFLRYPSPPPGKIEANKDVLSSFCGISETLSIYSNKGLRRLEYYSCPNRSSAERNVSCADFQSSSRMNAYPRKTSKYGSSVNWVLSKTIRFSSPIKCKYIL